MAEPALCAIAAPLVATLVLIACGACRGEPTPTSPAPDGAAGSGGMGGGAPVVADCRAPTCRQRPSPRELAEDRILDLDALYATEGDDVEPAREQLRRLLKGGGILCTPEDGVYVARAELLPMLRCPRRRRRRASRYRSGPFRVPCARPFRDRRAEG